VVDSFGEGGFHHGLQLPWGLQGSHGAQGEERDRSP
jgi:hypothetical protein